MKDRIEQRKFYYPDGKLQAERSYKKGLPHGLHREWYENGVLATEVNYIDGVPDGIGKQWDKNGDLIVSYEILNGTGVQKIWDSVQECWIELPWFNGTITGRQRLYINEREITGEAYYIHGKQVSRKRYLEECKQNRALPRYENTEIEKEEPSVKRPPKRDNDNFCRAILSSGNATEAREWFKSGRCFLGEDHRAENSIEFVKSLYEAGAVKVWVLDISVDELGQNSGRLIVEMPKECQLRERVFAICDEVARDSGYDPECDCGQEFRLLMLD